MKPNESETEMFGKARGELNKSYEVLLWAMGLVKDFE